MVTGEVKREVESLDGAGSLAEPNSSTSQRSMALSVWESSLLETLPDVRGFPNRGVLEQPDCDSPSTNLVATEGFALISSPHLCYWPAADIGVEKKECFP